MPYFRDDEARTIIRDAYAQVRSEAAAVAETFYPPEDLALLPRDAVVLALGVGHPLGRAGLRAGETVLDLGCGAGIDTLLAAHRVGPGGKVIGVDMTPEMVSRARENAARAGLGNVEIRQGLMEALPVSDASVDVAISNGVLNLSTRKSRVLAETVRVLKPGGRVAFADLVLDGALPEEVLKSPAALAG
jgi:ubiquinone/menaquinone biosynthesis C-methylase UbiE